jgi:hypothetical protein
MNDKTDKVKRVSTEKPEASETAFDTTSYFKEAMELRKPLQPVIRKANVLAEVHVGRPHSDTWFQLNPSETASMEAYVIKDKDKVYYYVDKKMLDHPLLYPRLKPVTLVEAATWPPTVPYIIPFHHPSPDRDIPAYTSAWVAYEQALSGVWTQIRWEEGIFQVAKAENNPHSPTFSGKPMWELLALGFKSRIIRDADHAYVRSIRGVAAE